MIGFGDVRYMDSTDERRKIVLTKEKSVEVSETLNLELPQGGELQLILVSPVGETEAVEETVQE